MEHKTVGGHFERLGLLLGTSTSGTFLSYDGCDTSTGESVVICTLKPALARDPLIRQMVEFGLSRVALLDHPSFMKVLARWSDELECGYVMKKLGGSSVGRALRDGAIFTESEVVSVGRSLLSALSHAHARDVVFGNVKGTNVMLLQTRDQTLIVALPKPPPDFKTVRQVAAYLEIPQDCAPELLDRGQIDARSDVYGVGLLLYEMSAGQLPFNKAFHNIGGLVEAIVEVGIPPITGIIPNMSPRLAEVITKAVARDPADRFTSSDEMANALRRVGARNVAILPPKRLKQLVRDVFPSPLAQPFSSMDAADDPQTKIHLLVDTAQVLVQLLAIFALAARIADGTHQFGAHVGAREFARPSLGHWTAFLRDAVRTGCPAMPELQDISTALDALVPMRNEIRHGVSPTTGAARRRLLEYQPILDAALVQARFLRKYHLFVVKSLDYRDNQYLCRVHSFRGSHPLAAIETLTPPRPLTIGHMYLASPGLDHIVDLHPLMLYESCPVCEDEEIFMYESAGDQRVHYVSPTKGHVLYDEKILGELEGLGLLLRQ